MHCTRCGLQVKDGDRFCCRCGSRTELGREMQATPQLMLDKTHKKIAGVCAGFARYFEADVTLIRVLWLAVALAAGVGFLAYLAAWIIMPSDRGAEPNAHMHPEPWAARCRPE